MFGCDDKTKQGDLGEARAVYEFVRLGYVVSKPMQVHVPYDLIVDKEGVLYRVQVKTSGRIVHQTTNTFEVYLETSGGNTTSNNRKHFDPSLVDLVFVLTSDDRCWIIPTSEITSKTTIKVGTPRYDEFQIAGDRRCRGREVVVKSTVIDRRKKTPPFAKEELARLLWEMPTTDIAKQYNLSDNGVARWASKWNLDKPPRGYWSKNKKDQRA